MYLNKRKDDCDLSINIKKKYFEKRRKDLLIMQFTIHLDR